MLKSLRTCCVCRKMLPKTNLIRVVKTSEGKIFVDYTGKADGRGAYVCKSSECRSKLKKIKGLNKAFKCQINDEIYDEVFKKEN